MLTKLTINQKKLEKIIKEKYISNAHNGNDDIDIDITMETIGIYYKKKGHSNFEIVVCDSPLDMYKKTNTTNDNIGIKYDSGWTAFYDYFLTIGINCNDKIKNKFLIWKNFILNSGVYYTKMYDTTCYVCRKPNSVNKNTNKQLHCENGPAMKWRDGYSIYALNGIIVPKEIVTTPAEMLDPNLILNEQNVDIQREIIKKIGADIVLKKLNAKALDIWIDPNTNCKYELMRLKAGELDRIYLYYEHASIPGYFYAMPVPPECSKAMHARAWILGLIERGELSNISQKKEGEIINNLPNQLS